MRLVPRGDDRFAGENNEWMEERVGEISHNRPTTATAGVGGVFGSPSWPVRVGGSPIKFLRLEGEKVYSHRGEPVRGTCGKTEWG